MPKITITREAIEDAVGRAVRGYDSNGGIYKLPPTLEVEVGSPGERETKNCKYGNWKCKCNLSVSQVCAVCQKVTGREKDSPLPRLEAMDGRAEMRIGSIGALREKVNEVIRAVNAGNGYPPNN